MKSDQIKKTHAESRENLTIIGPYCFVVFAFIESTLFTHQHTKLHLKSPKHFISLASFHLIVYTKTISISLPLYNAVFSIYKYQ